MTTTNEPTPVEDMITDTAAPGSDLMSTKQVAARFNRSARTVRNWVRDGFLTPIRIGGAVFYHTADVEHLATFGFSSGRNTAS